MKTRIVPYSVGDAAWQLAVEEALFKTAKEEVTQTGIATPIVRTYSFAQPSVILGYGQKIDEVNLDFCRENNIDVTMRSTGGGSVYLTDKELQYMIITPEHHSISFMEKINTRLIHAMQDRGVQPELKISNKHPVIRLNNKSFVFDAQRRNPNVLLHHGTTMMDRQKLEELFRSLNATQREKEDIMLGMTWLNDIQEITARSLSKPYHARLAAEEMFVKDLTIKERKRAQQLYNAFYNKREAFSFGKKKYGICYLPSTQYNMEEYAVDEGSTP